MLYWTVPNNQHGRGGTGLLFLENRDLSQCCLDFGFPVMLHKPHRNCDHQLSFYASEQSSLFSWCFYFLSCFYTPVRNIYPDLVLMEWWCLHSIPGGLFKRTYFISWYFSGCKSGKTHNMWVLLRCVSGSGMKGGKLKVSFNPWWTPSDQCIWSPWLFISKTLALWLRLHGDLYAEEKMSVSCCE